MKYARHVNLLNFFLLVIALGASSALAINASKLSLHFPNGESIAVTSEQPQRYKRIASASVIADEILLELCDPTRIIAFTEYNQRESLHKERYAGKSIIRTLDDVEGIAALKPDLVIAHEVSDQRHVNRLQEMGMRVLDLGNVTGTASLLENISRIGDAVGNPREAEALRAKLIMRLKMMKALSDTQTRHSAVLIFSDGKRLYSVGDKTTYNEVLKYAGLDNVFESRFSDLLEVNTELILKQQADIVVTDSLSAPHLCRAPGWDATRYCTNPKSMIVLDEKVLVSSGLGIVDTMQVLYNALHNAP